MLSTACPTLPAETRFAARSGIITQDNLQLRESALSALKLPVTVRAGRVGRLVIRVPWRHLASQPIEVELDEIEVLASTNYSLDDPADADLATRIKQAIDAKTRNIQTAEIARAGRAAVAADSYFEILGRKIAENVIITVCTRLIVANCLYIISHGIADHKCSPSI